MLEIIERHRRAASAGAAQNEVDAVRRRHRRDATIDPELAEQIRASFLLAGPLLARFGRAEMPPPGGDFIGRRRLDPHIDAFEALGAVCDCDGSFMLTPSAACAPATCSWTSPP